MDSIRDIVTLVRTALEEKAQRDAGNNPKERRPLSDILAEQIPGELIPGLRDMYLTMIGMSAQWQQKGFQLALNDAATNNKLLSGYSAATWMAWGGLLLALLDFLDTPQAGLGGVTAKDALLADYIPGTDILPTIPQPEQPVEPEQPAP